MGDIDRVSATADMGGPHQLEPSSAEPSYQLSEKVTAPDRREADCTRFGVVPTSHRLHHSGSSARHAVRIAGRTEASAQCFDEPNGNVCLLAFQQRRALIGNQQLLTGDQRSEWPAHSAFVFAHRIFPALECILLSTFLERDLLSQ